MEFYDKQKRKERIKNKYRFKKEKTTFRKRRIYDYYEVDYTRLKNLNVSDINFEDF